MGCARSKGASPASAAQACPPSQSLTASYAGESRGGQASSSSSRQPMGRPAARQGTPSRVTALANAQQLLSQGQDSQQVSAMERRERRMRTGSKNSTARAAPTSTTPHVVAFGQEDAKEEDHRRAGREVSCLGHLCSCICGPTSGDEASRRLGRGQPPSEMVPELEIDLNSSENDWLLTRVVSHESRASSMTPKRRFIVTNRGRIQDVYAFEGRKLGHLGTGGYATVFKGQRKNDGTIRAIKAINLQRAGRSTQQLDRLVREINIMKLLDHPGIIKLYETWEDKKDLYLVMELCTGGELFGRICSAIRFSEEEAAMVMRQVMSAVVYMHEKGVVHRDLKPENFLFLYHAPIRDNVLKLIDFGLSRTFEAGDQFWTRIGTPYYVAPQVLQGCYDELVDVWSAGVLMYVLLCGYPPFIGDSDKDITEAVLRGRFDFAPEDWEEISEDAKELIAWMLAFRPEHRACAREALDHIWIHDMAPHAHYTKPLDASRVKNLQKFCSMHPFKKATLGVIASLLHEDKIALLRDMFRGMDKSGSGVLSAQDLMEGMRKAGIGEIALDLLEMERVVKACDENGSGGIDYTEFLAAAMDEAHYLQEDICWSAFCVFDRDGDGKISLNELCEVLHDDGVDMALAHATAEELIKQIDRAGDGAISFDEFMHMLRQQH